MSQAIKEKEKIQQALTDCQAGDWQDAAERLLNAIGYHSTRKLPSLRNTPAQTFIKRYKWKHGGEINPDTKSQTALINAAKTIDVIFQYTKDEITQTPALISLGFDEKEDKSFAFVAVELHASAKSPSRSEYASHTREINKRFRMPSVVLFRHKTEDETTLTLAFVNRRPHRIKSGREVLEKVSLVKDINSSETHRGHLDIIHSLTLRERLKWMDTNKQPKDFDGLLRAWLDELDTEALNKRFYGELLKWYEWASSEARFPEAAPMSDHIIRLITRLLFIWFIKEKGLVADELFIARHVDELINDFNESAANKDEGNYYRAILQNLFFATLNTEISKRGFTSRVPTNHRDFNRYRYASLLKNKTELKQLMDKTPFINGGLFDCLDSEEAERDGGKRIDMFTDPDPKTHRAAKRARNIAWKQLHVPDYLFFDTKRGLLSILNKYKFTVAENTPIECEVALDPELLGKVFENLLATTNPETQETARRQTGSFYTPRPIVDYMVNESLITYLTTHTPPDNESEDKRPYPKRLRNLCDYTDANTDKLFSDNGKQNIIDAISHIKILDPAVGSGAYPMGALHKLTLILERLDKGNTLWREAQKAHAIQATKKAYDEEKTQQARKHRLDEIDETFERYSSAFGRKLYLIQNSIYGVDIQPIACQIAKLRFFISLAIEQESNGNKGDNYGIKPLPNLETRILAANTLIGLTKRETLPTQDEQTLLREIQANRERHFNAKVRKDKLACINADKKLRNALAIELKDTLGISSSEANRVAKWNPFNQTTTADWFDAEYMFSVIDGFDVVIGNPPYVQLQKNGGELADLYQPQGYATFARSGDIYCLFYEQGINLSKKNSGILCYITSNKWMRAKYGKKLRAFFIGKNPMQLLDLGPDVFEAATVDTNILLIQNNANKNHLQATSFKEDYKAVGDISTYIANNHAILKDLTDDIWFIGNDSSIDLKKKIEEEGKPLKEWDVQINYGIKTGCNEVFVISQANRDELIAADPNSEHIIKPILRGRDIQRYHADWAGLYLINAHNGYGNTPPVDIEQYPAVKAYLQAYYPQLEARQDQGITPYNLRSCAYLKEFTKEKIVWTAVNSEYKFTLASPNIFFNNSMFMITGSHLSYLCAILNSNICRKYTTFLLASEDNYTYGSKEIFEKLPIPPITDENRGIVTRIESLVDGILAAKKGSPDADTKQQEAEIDGLVYELYGLTEAEIKTIEDAQ